MRIRRSDHAQTIVLTLTGDLDGRVAPTVRGTLLQAMREHPAAVICDLADLASIDAAGAEVFASATHPASGWPTTRLLLCGARPAVTAILAQRAIARCLPSFDTLGQALRQVSRRRPRARAYLRLESPHPQTQAAQFVREQCDDWNAVGLAEQAGLLAEALVAEALATHPARQPPRPRPRPDMMLRVELGPEQLGISVHDPEPRWRHSADPVDHDAPADDPGLVRPLAAAWGARPDPDGGKILWADLARP